MKWKQEEGPKTSDGVGSGPPSNRKNIIPTFSAEGFYRIRFDVKEIFPGRLSIMIPMGQSLRSFGLAKTGNRYRSPDSETYIPIATAFRKLNCCAI